MHESWEFFMSMPSTLEAQTTTLQGFICCGWDGFAQFCQEVGNTQVGDHCLSTYGKWQGIWFPRSKQCCEIMSYHSRFCFWKTIFRQWRPLALPMGWGWLLSILCWAVNGFTASILYLTILIQVCWLGHAYVLPFWPWNWQVLTGAQQAWRLNWKKILVQHH